MGEKKVDRFIFKISDKLGEGSYGQVAVTDKHRCLKASMKNPKNLSL